MISHLQTSIIVFKFCVCFDEFTKTKGPSIHEEAWARIFAHLQAVLTAWDPVFNRFMDAMNVIALQNM